MFPPLISPLVVFPPVSLPPSPYANTLTNADGIAVIKPNARIDRAIVE